MLFWIQLCHETVKGFLVFGVWPFNRIIFTPDKYTPAIIIDIILHNILKIIEYQETYTAITIIHQSTSNMSLETIMD